MNKALSHLDLPVAAGKTQPLPDALTADDIRGHLERILASLHFRDSLRLKRFLTFVIETALNGKADSIKAYTIAVEALDRADDFDPQNDPIVRVEAGRLRQALGRYYAKEGRDDHVLIDLPRGTYVPNFRRRAGETPASRTVHEDSSLASASVASPREHPGRIGDLDRNAFASIEHFDARRGQMKELSVVVCSVSQTMRQSHALLKSSALLDFRARPAPPQAPTAAEAPLPAEAAPASPDEALPVSIADRQPQAQQRSQTAPLKRRIQSLIAPAATGVRAHARIFRIAFAAIALLAILEVLFDIDHPLIGGPDHGLVQNYRLTSTPGAAQRQGGEAAPLIYVEPLTVVGTPPAGAISVAFLRQRIMDVLARFDDVTVVGAPVAASAGPAASAVPPSSVYQFAGVVQYSPDDRMLVTVRLVDAADHTVVWSKSYPRHSQPDSDSGKGRIVSDIAESLLSPFGVIEPRERVKRAAADPMQDTYRCILDANVYLRSFDPSQYQPVHDCLVRASAEEPASVSVFVDLARVTLRAYRMGIVGAPGDGASLEAAYRMAERAADIKPNSANAQDALQDILLVKGDIARAKIAGDRAYRLNPYDPAIVFGHAMLLILTGQVDDGMALLDKNSAKSPAGWIGYHMLMALGSYLKGDFNTASTEARQIASPTFPPGLVLDALAASKIGDLARAQQDIAMLHQFYPAWDGNIRASVARFLPEPAMAQRIAADFTAAVATTQ
jgi:adenylate cyclase